MHSKLKSLPNIFTGPPIFVNENTLTKNVNLYQPLTVKFSLYSNPIVEEIWIEGVALNYTNNETKRKIHCFKISEIKLKYTEFKSNAFIKGKVIEFEVKMFSHEYEMYRIWTTNRLGEASTTFKIQAVGKIILKL